MRVAAVVPAAGSGRRLKAGVEKPYIFLKRKPIIIHTLERLSSSPLISEIILAVNKRYVTLASRLIKKFKIRKIKAVVCGGKSRGQSVYNGLKCVSGKIDIVLIHDGVRPVVDNNLIAKVIKTAGQFNAAVSAVPAVATLKEANSNLLIKNTLPREKIWVVQTPQAFKKDLIIKAYTRAGNKRNRATDDAFLVEQLGYPVKIVEGSYSNIKITTKEDLLLAKSILK